MFLITNLKEEFKHFEKSELMNVLKEKEFLAELEKSKIF